MTNRREFLQLGIAAAALPVAPHAASPAAGVSVTPIYKAIYDTRFPESVAFARRMAERGIATHAIDGDVTALWYHDLYHRWREGPVAIAGLTAHGALFCLEQLAWDQRMRVVFRGQHDFGLLSVDHRFSGPRDLLRGLALRDVAWSERIADLIAACPSAHVEIGACEAATLRVEHQARQREELHSWLIAPVTRV